MQIHAVLGIRGAEAVLLPHGQDLQVIDHDDSSLGAGLSHFCGGNVANLVDRGRVVTLDDRQVRGEVGVLLGRLQQLLQVLRVIGTEPTPKDVAISPRFVARWLAASWIAAWWSSKALRSAASGATQPVANDE
jgi:hypothetical protein